MRFVSYGDRKRVAQAMRAIYTAPALEAAEVAFNDFDQKFGEQYPGAVDVWRLAWEEFIPFLDYPVELRKVVYTTNAIESINFQLRKITKNRGHFTDKDAAMELLYRVAQHLQHPGGTSGTATPGWKKVLNTLARLLRFPGFPESSLSARGFQADRDLVVVGRTQASKLDPSTDSGTGAKMGLDATVPQSAPEMRFT